MSKNDTLQNADGKNEIEAKASTSEEKTTPNDTKVEIINDIEETLNLQTLDEKEVPKEDYVNEIEVSNAEDAEDASNAERHNIEKKDYHSMSLNQLAIEFNRLLKHHKIQTISKHVNEIKAEFNAKFDALVSDKKEDFINDGGDPLDFYYTDDNKKLFNTLYKDYKQSITQYYKEREKNLKQNLKNRLDIIEEIKELLNTEEHINTTYNLFKDLQEKWRNAGPIPRDKYNTAWNTYHHHVERFYDFLHLNNDLRDLDFKHNYEQKLKIIERAELLAEDDNVNRTFRELQELHKLWKEELGPVAKTHRETLWNRFSTATKVIHNKRQAYYADLDKAYEKNLENKKAIIAQIEAIPVDKSLSHSDWQKKIKTLETLRDAFFNAGKVPSKANEAIWTTFKNAVRHFNRSKNTFYKNLKATQYKNLQNKKDLIKIAEDHKDSEDFTTATPLMKKIQNEWKKIGHVPRRDSDKIWEQFKTACNHYFDRVHAKRQAENQELHDAYDKKTKLLEQLKELKLPEDTKSGIATLREKVNVWKTIGQVPQNKRYIDDTFYKAIDHTYDQLKMDKATLELLKFESKLERLSTPNDTSLLENEQHFIRKKISDLQSEINQLENNLQFFSNVKDDNPLVKDVHKNITQHKKELDLWKAKLAKIRKVL